ncbi:DEAD-box ATP-dependent RNA helicase 36-like [Elaeis guineensis]|uniref:DEAD-box ATP-dependent RNA helicase 36-like n=1 Tax=Elaeis guineensis var. tenera TaxID=51953 RepID=UPI003C6D1E41
MVDGWPISVQHRCILCILIDDNILGITQTDSEKAVVFTLSILYRFTKDPYGVFALILTSTREFTYQLSEHLQTLSSSLNMQYILIIGRMDMIGQARALQRPHIVVINFEKN